VRLALLVFCLVAFPHRSPAPLIFRPGEGWNYERPGTEGKWSRTRAKDQLEVAQAAFDKKDYSLALKAARRTVKLWPLSDYAPDAQYLMGRCYEAKKMDEKAFKQYQIVLEKYPKAINYNDVLLRQFEIANRFLAGQWFRLFGYIPAFPSMEKTSDMYDKIIKNGPYGEVAPRAQMSIGTAREKQKEWGKAVKAYERAADRYSDRPDVAAEALYKAGLAYNKEAKTAEYDQSAAGKAILAFSDFSTLYPNDPRVPEAQKLIESLKSEQARGSFEIAKFYEKRKRWEGAVVYYNEVLLRDPSSPLAGQARKKIDELKKRTTRVASK
ncbi:MAG: repeat containing protein, partial [Verrucomicrobiales bacterium]|nr:repeat containing protein [Verrucomicrobiales bacterium]